MVESDKRNIISTIKELMEINKIPKIQLKDMKLKKQIGEGGQAKVYRGTYNNEEVAVKVLEEVDRKCLAHEIVIISNLHHKSIPKFYGIILEDGVIGLVNKYISGKPLDEYNISEFNEKQKVQIVKSLAHTLSFIHENEFIHRDLKPENIMIDFNFNFFLIDFGIAKVVTGQNNAYTRAKGTVHYLAPETLEVAELTESEEIVSAITTQVDTWAFGCIVSYLFSAEAPRHMCRSAFAAAPSPPRPVSMLQLAIVSASDDMRVIYTVHDIRYGPNMGTDVLGAPILDEQIVNFTHTNGNISHLSQYDTILVNLGSITNLRG